MKDYHLARHDDLKKYFAEYDGDATLIEPQLVTTYDAIMPRIDKALGTTPK